MSSPTETLFAGQAGADNCSGSHARPNTGERQAGRPPAQGDRMANKILVVDNSLLYLEVLRDALTDRGYAVITATDGLDALDRLQEDRPDLVITDLIMPWIDGQRLCRYMKRDPVLRSIPVLLISGVGAELPSSWGPFGPEAAVAKGHLAEFVPTVVGLVEHLLATNGCHPPEAPTVHVGGIQPREIVRDLLSHRRHLEALRDTMGACVVEVTPAGRIGYVNPAGLALLETTEQQVLGQRVWDVFGAEAAEAVRQAVTQALRESGPPAGPVIVERARRFIEISLGRLPADGAQPGAILAFKEVTAAVRQEREIRALYTVASAANESLDLDAVLGRALDATLSALKVDRGLIRLFDPESEELVLRTQRGFSPAYVAGCGRIRIGEKVAGRVAATGEPLLLPDIRGGAEYAHLHSEDEAIVSLAVIPLKGRGRLLGSLSIAAGIRRTLGPEDLDLLLAIGHQLGMTLENARLFDERQRAYNELHAALEQLVVSERLKALGEMAAGVAHDFNNLLAAILGRVELMLLDLLPAHIHRGLEVVQQATLDAASAVRRLQDFGSNRPTRRQEPTEVSQLIRDVLAFLEPRLRDEVGRRGGAIEVDLDLQGGVVRGDPAELRDALMNIIKNALDAMPTGGRLEVHSRRVDKEVEIVVVDTGCGMSAETSARVFDPFFTTKAGRGMGLGMSVTHGTIRRHGGRIQITSAPGRGTTVAVALPAAGAEAGSPDRPPMPMAAGPGPRGQLLIVDDEPGLREILATGLRFDGHEVVTADGGRAALEVFAREPFDLVLTDLGMPDISGLDVVRQIKATRPDLAIGLMSGWDVTEDSLRAQGATVDFVVRKPFALGAIQAQIRAALAAR
jgi:PAS domain S-box-containing protein